MEEDYKEENPFFNKLRQVFSLAFQVILFLFLVVLLIREFFPETINPIMDISWFLLFIIIFGVLSLLFPTRYVESVEGQIISRDFFLTVLLGTLIGFNVFLGLKGAGSIGYFLGLISGIVVIAIFFLVLFRRIKKVDKNSADKNPRKKDIEIKSKEYQTEEIG